MAMDVKGPGQQPSAVSQNRTPAAMQQAKGPSGAQALKNAEKAFDQTFFSGVQATEAATVALIPGAFVPDALGEASVKQQVLDLFAGLKEQFLKQKPAGKTADAFESPVVQALASRANDGNLAKVASDMHAQGAQLPKEVKQALAKLNDAFWTKKLEAMTETAQLQSSASAYFQTGPGARDLERLRPLAAPMIKQMYAPITTTPTSDTGPSTQTEDTGTGPGTQTDTGNTNPTSSTGNTGGTGNATGTVTVADGSQNVAGQVFELPPDVASKIAGVAFRLPMFEGDLESQLQMLFIALAKDAERDLRDMMKDMQDKMKLKQIKRDLLRQMKEAQAELKKEAQKQLEDLKAQGKVDDTVTIDDYLAYAQVSFTEPQLNEETLDVSYTPPSIGPPDPLPEGWAPQSDPPDDNTDDDDEGGGGGSILDRVQDIGAQAMVVNSDAMDLMQGLTADQGGGGLGVAGAGDGEGGGRGEDPQAPLFGHDAPISGHFVGDTPGASQQDPETSPSGDTTGDGDPAKDGAADAMSYDQFGISLQKVEDELDGLSSQTELDQMRMQIFIDRRQKAFEACSNLLKTTSDTKGAIIKNTT